jgi:hypothetical protein
MPQALILQVPRDGPLHRQLSQDPPPSLAGEEVVIEPLPGDAEGNLDPPAVGEVVLSVPSPESLSREPHELRRVLRQAGAGVEPLVVVIEAAEELRDEEVAPLLDAVRHASRPVIVRVIRNA